jgi:aspartate aminotransferase
MAAEGKTVYSFAAGEPDFDTPEHIKAEASARLAEGKTKYAPTPGLPDLRQAIADKLSAENGLAYDSSQVVVSIGAKHSLFNVMMTICREGDEIIIPGPYWLSYPEMVRVAGGSSVFVMGTAASGLKVTPEQIEAAVTDKTKALVLNTPSNPTGAVYTPDELKAIGELAVAKDFYIISDEIYEKILYDGAEHVSLGSISPEIFERTITVNGFSKAYSMTGWRLGYTAGPIEITNCIGALQSHSTSGATTFAQYGGIAALRGPKEPVEEMVKAFAERRTYMYDRLTSIQGVDCIKPMGAFYMFPSIAGCGIGSVDFAERLLADRGVAVIPGAAFGADGHIRLSYACSMENIEKGLDELEKFVAEL